MLLFQMMMFLPAKTKAYLAMKKRLFPIATTILLLILSLVPTYAQDTEQDAADDGSEASSSEEASLAKDPVEVEQWMIIRRQEAEIKASKKIQAAEAALVKKDLEEAQKALAEARKILTSKPQISPDSAAGKVLYPKVEKIEAWIELYNADQAYQNGDLFKAMEGAQKALQLDPSLDKAQKLAETIRSKLSVNMRDGQVNPALNPYFVRRVQRVKQLIKEGQDYLSTGQLDKAEQAFRTVLSSDRDPDLRNDPYNITAAKYLQEIQKQKRQFADEAANVAKLGYDTDVKKAWSEDIRAVVSDIKSSSSSSVEAVPITRRNDFEIQRKLRSLILPQVDFSDASIKDAADYLTSQSRAIDPENTGVSFLVQNAASDQSKTVTISLRDVPIGEALRYITRLAEVKFKVDENAVLIVPLSARTDVLVTRRFKVRPKFIADAIPEADSSDTDSRRRGTAVTQVSTSGDQAKAALENLGMEFPEGAQAIYSSVTSLLTVRNTQDQIDLLEELLWSDQANDGIAKLVRVQTKVLEVAQVDLEELATNWALTGEVNPLGNLGYGVTPIGGSHMRFGAVQAGTSLRGASNSLPANSLDALIGNKPADVNNGSATVQFQPNAFSVRGMIDGNAFSMMVSALQQKTSSSIISSPSIVVSSGSQGVIEVVREFYYPTNWTAPVIEGSANATVPSWPDEFIEDPRKVGLSMTVLPTVDADNRLISIELEPEFTDFQGFIDYGPTISEQDTGDYFERDDGDGNVDETYYPNGTPSSPNTINVPVFFTRKLEGVSVDVLDGYTMVVAGLIREQLETVDDSVPILSDIPLIGRAFRSKVERSSRRNLMMFVSPRILRPDGQPVNPTAGQ